MPQNKKERFDEGFSFYRQLALYYSLNKRKIRACYKPLTRKLIAYNDSEDNPQAFLRKPQLEALEMHIFIKEFMENAQVHEMFDEWRHRRGRFADDSYYSINDAGQENLFDALTEKQADAVFRQMEKYRECYPNYIYALAMGLGKTVLMAACIFYEFLLAAKYPSDPRFCHNALVFAPDKTVLQSLREIMTLDKAKIVPPEYVAVLDANIKFHFLDEAGGTLNAIDGSDFNIIISNTQKIILKKRRAQAKPAQALFEDSSFANPADAAEESGGDAWDEASLMENQRFKKLCRFPSLGVFVDEAHHLFGADLERQLRAGGARKTSLRDTINQLARETSIVACFNYTGTPYVNNQVLPEVVYAYGLKESIQQGYLKDADPIGYKNVKSGEFLKDAVQTFLRRYGGKTYEGMRPKMAIYAAGVEEAATEVKPALERILADEGIPASSILLNVGDPKRTSDADIRDFNNLDAPGTEGSEKQFIILVEKGKEGWNCRSLFAAALYREPKSKIFVLQAAMRCLRSITDERQSATIFLSKENFDTLNDELNKNFNMEIRDMRRAAEGRPRRKYQVRVIPPPRKIMLKRVWHEYSLKVKEYAAPLSFNLAGTDLSAYKSVKYGRGTLAIDTTVKESDAAHLKESRRFSSLSLAAEAARYLNIPCLLAAHVLRECADGEAAVLDAVNRHNDVLYDIVVPAMFHALYEVSVDRKEEEREVVLLREPEGSAFYEFSADEDLVVRQDEPGLTEEQKEKSFHADTYCFDSLPERECFIQYVRSGKVKEVYFTGMFTSPAQSDLLVHYYDSESGQMRKYYPDFFARMNDGSCRLIEVKADSMADDAAVKAKQAAAEEMSDASGVEYFLYRSSSLLKTNVLEDEAAGTLGD